MSEADFDIATDLKAIRIEQARGLKEKAKSSAATVLVSVITYTALITAAASITVGVAWFIAANFMIIVTLLYAKYRVSGEITEHNFQRYLFGHIIICAFTGMVWGGFAIYVFDSGDPFAFLVAITLPSILTIGGMLPSSIYRPGYIALAVFALLPFGLFLTLTLPGINRIYGLGIILFLGLGMLASAQAELNTRDGIIARRAQLFAKSLFEKNLEIKRANEDKSRFLASTTHDFSQPLHAQGYYIDALSKHLKTNEQLELLKKTQGAWRAQKNLLQGLAEVTRLESGAIVPNLRAFALQPVINHTVSDLMPEAIAKDITVETALNEEFVFSDPQLLARIIQNILHNAIKFTDKKGSVKLSSAIEGANVILSIQDSGVGLTAEEQDHIFDAYYRSDSNIGPTGSGLGLSIVKRLCDLLHLEFDLISEKGKGTHFKFKLPVSPQDMTDSELIEDEGFTFSNNPFIVLIDDNDDIRESMLTELTHWGLKVIATRNKQDAITLLSTMLETPCLLIVDKRLSHGEDGIETISALREELNADIQAVLMTGDVSGFDAVSEKDDIQILLKPVLPSDLKRIIWNSVSR